MYKVIDEITFHVHMYICRVITLVYGGVDR